MSTDIDMLSRKMAETNLDGDITKFIEEIDKLKDEDKRDVLATTQEHLNFIETMLSSNEQYIPIAARKYLIKFFTVLEPTEYDKIKDLLEKKTTHYPHINASTRKMLRHYLNKWKTAIVAAGVRPLNRYFLQNSLVHPDFSKFLLRMGYSCSSPLAWCKNFTVTGAVTRDVFFDKLKDYDANCVHNFIELEMRYENAVRVDDTVKFGDQYSSSFCDFVDRALPLPLHNMFAGNSGRSTAGAYVSLECTTSVSKVDDILTVAHVPFKALDCTYNDGDESKIELNH